MPTRRQIQRKVNRENQRCDADGIAAGPAAIVATYHKQIPMRLIGLLLGVLFAVPALPQLIRLEASDITSHQLTITSPDSIPPNAHIKAWDMIFTIDSVGDTISAVPGPWSSFAFSHKRGWSADHQEYRNDPGYNNYMAKAGQNVCLALMTGSPSSLDTISEVIMVRLSEACPNRASELIVASEHTPSGNLNYTVYLTEPTPANGEWSFQHEDDHGNVGQRKYPAYAGYPYRTFWWIPPQCHSGCWEADPPLYLIRKKGYVCNDGYNLHAQAIDTVFPAIGRFPLVETLRVIGEAPPPCL